jgi:site-specific recombinase XerD
MTYPVFPNNQDLIEQYTNHLELKDMSPVTINSKLYKMISFFQFLNHKKIEDITRRDIEQYYISLKKQKDCGQTKVVTANKKIDELKRLFEWYDQKNNDQKSKLFDGLDFFSDKPDTSQKNSSVLMMS